MDCSCTDSPWDEFLFAVSVEDIEGVRKWLVHPEVHPSDYSNTALHVAVDLGYLDIIVLILSDPRAFVDEYMLREAAEFGDTEMLKILIAHPTTPPDLAKQYSNF